METDGERKGDQERIQKGKEKGTLEDKPVAW